MPISAARAATVSRLAHRDVLSDDGTRLRTWTNDPDGRLDGPTVVLCNGLGTNPYAWPALLRPDCGVRVVSWYHRGTGGSERPRDPERVGVEEFVEDGLSVMDAYDVDRAVLMGWSMGVTTMFQLALTHPERVRGLFAVAGVPGDAFSTMLGPLGLPRVVARTVGTGLAHTLRLGGRALTPISTRLPIGPRAIALLSHTGFMLRVADPDLAAVAVAEFLTTPLDWYAHLALRGSEHARVPLGGVEVPALFVGATWDVLAGARHLRTAAARTPGGEYVELNGSHFITMEQPDRVHRLLLDFLARVP